MELEQQLNVCAQVQAQQPRYKRKGPNGQDLQAVARSDVKPGPWILSWIRREIKTGKKGWIGAARRRQQMRGFSEATGAVGFPSVGQGRETAGWVRQGISHGWT